MNMLEVIQLKWSSTQLDPAGSSFRLHGAIRATANSYITSSNWVRLEAYCCSKHEILSADSQEVE